MTTNNIFKTDFGYTITIDCGENISAGTAFEIVVEHPSSYKETLTAALEGTNYIKYTVPADKFDAGVYKMQSQVTFGAGKFQGEPFLFFVAQGIIPTTTTTTT